MNENIDFNFTESQMLIKIFNSNEKVSYNLTDLARTINESPYHPSYRKICKYLIDNNILIKAPRISSDRYYEINKKLLKNLINSLDILKLAFEYYEKNHVVFK